MSKRGSGGSSPALFFYGTLYAGSRAPIWLAPQENCALPKAKRFATVALLNGHTRRSARGSRWKCPCARPVYAVRTHNLNGVL